MRARHDGSSDDINCICLSSRPLTAAAWQQGNTPMTARVLLFASSLLLLLRPTGASRCQGSSSPGPRNVHPIDLAEPVFVKSVNNGKLFTVGQGDDKKDLLHLWGTPYENGFAAGQLLGDKFHDFIKDVYTYTEGQIVANANNQTWCDEHRVACPALREVLKLGLTAALDLSYARTKGYIQPYVMQEIQGLADASAGAVSVVDIRNVMWLGELTRGACSMFGATGSATKSRGGKLLQLRALDWDVDGPFKDHACIVVYHPNVGAGMPWANVGFHGWTASITGFNQQQLGLSEIGVSYPDASFGTETYLAKGYPFGFLIRDILQFDTSLEQATDRIQQATRTCDLLLGVGDGKSNEFSGFQYSPHVARVVKPDSLLPANDSWHPQIADVVYWGMDWICPNDNRMLSEALKKHHGNLTAENTIADVTSYVTTGNLHIAIYDHAAMHMFVATARPDGKAGPLYAFQRQFTRLDMAQLFKEEAPRL